MDIILCMRSYEKLETIGYKIQALTKIRQEKIKHIMTSASLLRYYATTRVIEICWLYSAIYVN